ncbi:MAG: hypothetical protein EHM41_12520 [Chloroflexi bacterium]|nr:MAG: hypothetical protein EHM41_12520 [Chloroflexota bacterium]
MSEHDLQTWDLWFPQAAATGLPFARCRIQPVEVLLVHSAPPVLAVDVRDGEGKQTARGESLKATADTPITRLTLKDGVVKREDIWPGGGDIGSVVLMPGGEAGKLKSWWNAPDHSEWRWEIELYNKKGG